MTRSFTFLAVSALALGAAACKQEGTTVSANQPQTVENVPDEPGVANLGNGAAAAADSQAYVDAAAGSDLFEIATGKLAQQKGSSDAVKSFGAMLVEEHGKSAAELKAAAAKVPGMAIPQLPPAELQAKVDALRSLSGEAFDRQFIADQVAAHQQTLAAVNGFLAAAPPGPLKEHASRATGVVQKHLNQLNQMNQ